MSTSLGIIELILFEDDPECWEGQRLQFDIGAQAKSLPDLIYQLERAIIGHITISMDNDVEPFSERQEAPENYWEMFSEARLTVSVNLSEWEVPKAAVLPYVCMRVSV